MHYLNFFISVFSFGFYFACISLFPLVFIGEKNIEHRLLRAFQNNNFLKKVFFVLTKYMSFKNVDFKCSAPFIVNYPDVLAITTFFISSLLLALRNHKKEIFRKMFLQFSSENAITIYFPTKSCHFHASLFSFLKIQFNYLLEGTHYTFLIMIHFPSRKCVSHSVLDYSSSGSSIHGILQAIILEWVAIPFSRGSSTCRDWTWSLAL